MIKRALISVFDKTNVLKLAEFLNSKGIEIISTGGTYKYLKENNIPVIEVAEVTGFEEMLDGRVKTLHPFIHAGILAQRSVTKHMEAIKNKGIKPIDMVVVNLYPFFDMVSKDISFEEKVEFIDIGGPTMLRAAAKNFQDVIVLSDVNDYDTVIEQLEVGEVSFESKKLFAGKVFNLMSAYDGAISNFLLGDNSYPQYLCVSYKKSMHLRYGENPHQSAAFYVETVGKGALKDFEQLNGKELSYNNIKDLDIAWKVVCQFTEPVCCALKHNSPCGAAIAENICEAYKKTFDCDSISIYGGIVGFNQKLDVATAQELIKTFLEVVIAPEYEEAALKILKGKKNLRVIKAFNKPENKNEMVKVDGGILVQGNDNKLIDKLKVVTEKSPSEKEKEDMIFGMKIVKFVKSNAIVVVKDGMAKGIGGGQVNRIWAAIGALDRAQDGVILASDAYLPFGDIVEEAAKHNIKAIIQPGGSIRDQESIDNCNKYGISMIFTGIRHFKH